MARTHVEVYQGHDGQWYWRARAGNGKIIGQGEGYTRKTSAVRGVKRAYPGAVVEIIGPRSPRG